MNVKKNDLSWLGEKVTVTVDRPVGCTHRDMIYPLNYGFVDGLNAPDGEPQDVYILGTDKPLKTFTGTIAAIICREDDNEDKWVCVPDELLGMDICYECNIRHAVEFQEKFFRTKIYPLYEKTSGAVLYTEKDGKRRYLLTKSKKGHIGFPKGHIEYGESEYENAAREIREETGLPFDPHPDFRMEYTYTTLENTTKTGVFFLSHYEYRKPEFQQEEVTEDWLLPYDEALEKLNWEQDKVILEAAEKLLNKQAVPYQKADKTGSSVS